MPDPLASLDMTIEAPGRTGVDGSEVYPFDQHIFEERLKKLEDEKPEAFAVSLLNSFVNDKQ